MTEEIRKQEPNREGCTLFVASDSNPRKVAGAAAAMIKAKGETELRAVGSRAVSCEVKAAVIARSFLDLAGIRIETIPSFFSVTLRDEEQRGIRIVLRAVPPAAFLAGRKEPEKEEKP